MSAYTKDISQESIIISRNAAILEQFPSFERDSFGKVAGFSKDAFSKGAGSRIRADRDRPLALIVDDEKTT
ncbi:MAG TPA: hypothetical protein VH866_08335, partial [Candidatus Deferrimicrobiaceae bacterium]